MRNTWESCFLFFLEVCGNSNFPRSFMTDQSEGQLVLVHAGLEGPRSTFARRFTTVHDKRDVCSCHETRKPSLAPVVGQFSTLIGSSLVPYLYLHGSSTARSFLEGATRARVEVAAPKHAALSRWARDPRPSRRWPGRHPPPSNHVLISTDVRSHGPTLSLALRASLVRQGA